ncbi:hypothetical protein PN451_18475 [Dolichospermum planctonicum CS-1226]|uniref:Uncharacterized protein n=1 Tax=Dolichospermum planctonicum CS-1226 TaxID=3021751 RepID=A0ABT5AM36_9CYAN|nr:hypothetical protein [Dolichospermum planctonicum]MDB9537793.1 hypothetical protein [Dolichospermum planctonicum CS-1226]
MAGAESQTYQQPSRVLVARYHHLDINRQAMSDRSAGGLAITNFKI